MVGDSDVGKDEFLSGLPDGYTEYGHSNGNLYICLDIYMDSIGKNNNIIITNILVGLVLLFDEIGDELSLIISHFFISKIVENFCLHLYHKLYRFENNFWTHGFYSK